MNRFENFVIFSSNDMRNAYKLRNINIKNNNILEKCNQNDSKTTCKKIYYNFPFPQTNNINSNSISNDKAITSRIFQINNIPCAKFIGINRLVTEEKLKELLLSYNLKYPLVLKPVNGTQGYGITLNINDFNTLFYNVTKLQETNQKVIIEEQAAGTNYRILVLNGLIIDILRRELAYVIGDGKKTLYQLIQDRNHKQKLNNLYPTHNINYEYLKKQGGFTNESVVPKNKKINITNVANFHNGCNTYHVPLNTIHPDNLKLFIKINKVLKLNLSGIDYMANDISKPYYNDNHIVIEVNSGPDMKVHQMALPKENVALKFVDNLFQ